MYVGVAIVVRKCSSYFHFHLIILHHVKTLEGEGRDGYRDQIVTNNVSVPPYSKCSCSMVMAQVHNVMLFSI